MTDLLSKEDMSKVAWIRNLFNGKVTAIYTKEQMDTIRKPKMNIGKNKLDRGFVNNNMK